MEHSIGVAGAFGWKSSEFSEMMNALLKSGFHQVHGDYGVLDDISNPRLFGGITGKFLDAGTTAFNEGEKINRLVAFATAYREWKAGSAGAALDNRTLTNMLSRADDMTVNMSSANNAVWQKGLAAIPAQFFTYQARLTEQYLSKTLTIPEKARLMAVHSILFGVPTAVGGAVGVWPVYDQVKKYLIDNNIPYDDNVTQGILNGLPQLALRVASGDDVNIGQRYGTGGISTLSDIWHNPEKTLPILLGASGSILGDAAATLYPGLHALWDLASGNPNGVYPLDTQTLTLPLKDISTYNASTRLVYALMTGKWLSKYGKTIDNVTDGEAWLQTMTGANLERIQDMYLTNEISKDYKTAKNQALQVAEDYLTRADNLQPGDPQRQQYYTMAKAMIVNSGGTDRDITKALMNHVKGWGLSQVETNANNFRQDYYNRMNAQNALKHDQGFQ